MRAGLALAFALGAALLAQGCAAPPLVARTPARMEWAEVEATTEGAPAPGTQVVPTWPGQVVRIESRTTVRVAERVEGEAGAIDVYRTEVPTDGVVLLRAGLGARAWVLPATATPVWALHDRHLGREGFALEARLLAWADGPWRAPPGDDRFGLLAYFDDVVGVAPGGAVRAERDETAARAARRVLARRVSGVLRAPHHPPFFENELLAEWPGGAHTVRVEGPALLTCEVTAKEALASGELAVHVTERGKPRASLVRTVAAAAVVHVPVVPVPPGVHDYEVDADAALVTCTRAREIARLAHAGDERADLELAGRACLAGGEAGLCAVALGLGAADDELARRAEGVVRTYVELARALTRAESYDGARWLEARAAAGDVKALSTLANDVRESTDAMVAGAWSHAASQLSQWSVAGDAEGPKSWTLLERDPTCAGAPAVLRPLGPETVQVKSAHWRSAFAVNLAVDAPCDAASPITLEIDGVAMRAQPSAPTALWTVVVDKPLVTVRRVDGGAGRVVVLPRAGSSCDGHAAHMRAPLLASAAPRLVFGEGPPGLELWVREPARTASLRIVEASPDGGDPHVLDVTTALRDGASVALDDAGVRWLRAGRIALPPWAAKGVVVRGSAEVAVRALVRTVRAENPAERTEEPTELLDEARVRTLSKTLAGAPPERRAALHQERARLLARGGEARAAREDALAAAGLGAPGDPEAVVREALRPRERLTVRRPFGLEPDFDDGARRCEKSATSPRARLAVLDAEAHALPPHLDGALAARAVAVADPADPRLGSVTARALVGSRWRELRDGSPHLRGEAPPRVPRPREAHVAEGAVGPDGLLRLRALLDAPPDAVTISAERPATFALGSMTAGTPARLEITCERRAPSQGADEACPLELVVDGKPRPLTTRIDGTASAPLPARVRAQVRLKPSRAEWGAFARVVFERKVPNTRLEPQVGWVLRTPEMDRRFLLATGRSLEVAFDAPGLLRVAAWPEPGETPLLVALVDGAERVIPADGAWTMLPVLGPSVVRIVARTGAVNLDVAERVADETPPEPPPAVVPPPTPSPSPPVAFDDRGAWRDRAAAEPVPPRGPATWGTVQVTGALVSSNWREGATTDAPDTFSQQSLLLRRKLGEDAPWVALGALMRQRSGDPSLGARLSLFEELGHLRVAVGADAHAQRVESRDATTLRPSAYVAYGVPLRPTLTVFPRLGFDGYYTNLPVRPVGARQIDDDVYSPTRFFRRTLGYVQGILWWSPAFDGVFFARVRGSVDLEAGQLASTSARVGGLVSLGPVDVSAQLDGTSFAATPGARERAGVDVGPAGHVTTVIWISRGSVALEPGIGGTTRLADGRWQAFASLGLVMGEGRGRRDFPSNELGFFDGFVGAAPWRGSASGTGQ